MTLFSFPEQTKIVNIMPAKDINTSGLTAEYVDMEGANKATFLLNMGVIHASADSGVVTFTVGDDTAGTNSTATAASRDLTMDYYYITKAAGTAGAATADMWTKTAISSSTFTITSGLDGKMIAIEFDAAEMGQFTSGSSTYDAKAIKLAIANPTNSLIMSCVCILTGLRYAQEQPPTAL
jgi:hypothetical protein